MSPPPSPTWGWPKPLTHAPSVHQLLTQAAPPPPSAQWWLSSLPNAGLVLLLARALCEPSLPPCTELASLLAPMHIPLHPTDHVGKSKQDKVSVLPKKSGHLEQDLKRRLSQPEWDIWSLYLGLNTLKEEIVPYCCKMLFTWCFDILSGTVVICKYIKATPLSVNAK